ncbi:MAG: extracellular solute-binding protein [Chloroflexota bacterium]
MSRKIVFRTNERTREAFECLNEVLQAFAKPRNLEIDCELSPQGSEYSELILKTIHNSPVDVAEVGTSFLGDFVAMNALRPFHASEVQRLGSADAFVEHLWKAGSVEKQTWAIPWLSDVRLVFYRRDLLEKAGVREEGAFETPERFEQTLRQLKEAGIRKPWVAPTTRSMLMIHAVSSWIWYHGGQFIDAANKKVLIAQPETLAGLKDYYRLHKYFAPEWRDAGNLQADFAFHKGEAAVVISGPWMFYLLQQNAEIRDSIGVAAPLNHAFIGGSSLGIWKNSILEQASFEVIEYLTNNEFQSSYPQTIGMLPARLNALESYPFISAEMRTATIAALRHGREAPDYSLWGLVESRFATSLARLWTEVLENPDVSVDEVVPKHMNTAAHRLNSLLAQH